MVQIHPVAPYLMKLTILGAGVGACVPGKSIENLHPPGFLVEFDDQKILFDCSEGIRFRLEKAGHPIETVHHVAISHSHPDHYSILPFLLGIHLKGAWSSEHQHPGLNLYLPDRLVKNFPKLKEVHWDDMDPHPYLENLHPMSKEKPVTIGSGTLSGLKVHHNFGNADALAYRLETPDGIFAYSGDTGDCDGIRAVAKDADIFVCESSTALGDGEQSHKAGYGHLNAKQAAEIAKDGNVKHLILFHYTGADSDEAMIEAVKSSGFEGEITIGKDKQTFEV